MPKENTRNDRAQMTQELNRGSLERSRNERLNITAKRQLSTIIKKYRSSKSNEEKTAKRSLFTQVKSFSEEHKLPTHQAMKLQQMVTVITEIKEGKSPFIDLELFKNYLPIDEISVIAREGVLRGATIPEEKQSNQLVELKKLAKMLAEIDRSPTINLGLLNKYFGEILAKEIAQIALERGVGSEDKVVELKKLASMLVNISANTPPTIDMTLLTTYFGRARAEMIHRNALLHGGHIEKQSADDANHHLTIFTEVSWGTLGDYYAAVRLIRLLKETNPRLTINWVIKGKIEEIPTELKPSDTILINTVSEWDELFTRQSITDSIKKTQAIFVFPTFHFLKEAQIKRLKNEFDKEFISCLEYSYGIRKDEIDQVELQTGLGSDEMGIFILPHEGKHPLTQIAPDQPIIDILFREQKTPDSERQIQPQPAISPPTSDEQVLVNEIVAQNYNNTHHLFFGYANKELHRVINKGTNVGNFIRLCHEIAQSGPEQKNVDIVAPITLEDFQKLNINYDNYSRVSFIGNNDNEVLYTNPSSPDKPELRIINLFRFDNNTFQKLVHASHPFKMCTGDQSLSDVISSENALIFYQTMAWKRQLAENYLLIAEDALSAANMDPENAIAIKYIRLVKDLRTENPEDPASSLIASHFIKLKTMLVDPELLKQCQLINRYIIAQKNLNLTLPKYLSSFLNYLKNEEKLLGTREHEHQEQRTEYEQLLAQFIKKSELLLAGQITPLTKKIKELTTEKQSKYTLFARNSSTHKIEKLQKQLTALEEFKAMVIDELNTKRTPMPKDIGPFFQTCINKAESTREILKTNRNYMQTLVDFFKDFANFCIKVISGGKKPPYFDTTTRGMTTIKCDIEKINELLDGFVEKTEIELKKKEHPTAKRCN